MADRYQQLVTPPIGRIVAKQVGLPNPPRLQRYEAGQPVIDGPVLVGAATGSRLAPAVTAVLASVGAHTFTPMENDLRTAAAEAGLDAGVWNPDAAPEEQRFKALVFDATGIDASERLIEAYEFLHPTIRRVRPSGRVVVLGTPPEDCRKPPQRIAQRALE